MNHGLQEKCEIEEWPMPIFLIFENFTQIPNFINVKFKLRA